MKQRTIILTCIPMILLGCSSRNTEWSALTESVSLPTRITPSHTPVPPAISVPVDAPPRGSPTSVTTPTQAPTSYPTKQTVLVYENPGLGDGGISFYDFMISAYTEPEVLIYTDGLMLARQDDWYVQTQLTPSQICTTLADIRGAIDIAGPPYNATPLPEFGFGNGEPFIHLMLSDTPFTDYAMSVEEPPYRTEKSLRPFRIADALQTQYHSEPYSPDALLVWIEKVERSQSAFDDTFYSLNWPDATYDFPPLEDLLSGSRETLTVITGDSALVIMDSLGARPRAGLFEDPNGSYVILVRPLLPHESLERIQTYNFLSPYPVPLADLPFSCR